MRRKQSKQPRSVLALLRHQYPSAYAVLRSMDDHTHRFSECVWFWLQSAEKARSWHRALEDGYLNPDACARREDKLFGDGTQQRNKALRHLLGDMTKFLQYWSLGLSEALGATNAQGYTIRIERDGIPIDHAPGADISVLATGLVLLLAEAGKRLQHGFWRRREIYLHHVRRGALILPKPISPRSGRLNEVAMSLLFELVFTARLFTSGETRVVQAGEPMPDIGNPCWEVAAAFMNDALGTNYTRNDAETLLTRFLKRNPSVGWGVWLDPPEKYHSGPSHDMHDM
jgi:hypothetical protein